ncbi:hypothetical protein GPECTOR_43g896 [Gonium pectorale]|uniref:ABC transporter domain-containing protein n=1 Tax=Gonium pectorale TaxID=33097 RepID=A0A150GAS8_GONPE|nr:hypothetical protein GPECTOR_43g896 [Gonium pectorale]|eukprot:KXZ46460.1 hypothetical protein GPECTOR_43g896 [Gonium pectorale]
MTATDTELISVKPPRTEAVVDVPEASPGFAGAATPRAQGQRHLRICFKDICYTVASNSNKGEKVQLLRGVSGFFEPAQMTAVMGPSGSGKTTFLDLLSGRKTQGTMSGTLLFGSHAPTRTFLRRFTGYVEQFDTLVDTLTVYEMLLYTAELKRPLSEPLEAKRAAVERLIGRLALEKCRDVRIGSPLKRGISGGQAKRTNVGIALITTPAVLFLDEPTSGLDSFTAHEVMTVVRSLAVDDGTTICATIHSPSSACFALFDRVMVLASGWTVYFGGPGVAASDYLTHVCGARPLAHGENLAEWLMDFLTQADREGRSSALHESYERSELAQQASRALDGYLAEAQSRSAFARSGTATTMASSPSASPLPAAGGTEGASGSSPDAYGAAATVTAAAPSPSKSGLEVAAAAADGGGESWSGLAPGPPGLGGMVTRLIGSDQYVTPWWWSLKVLVQYRTLRNYQCMEYLGPRLFDKVIFAVVIMSLYLGIGDNFKPANVPSMAALMYLCVAQPAWGAVAYVPNIMMERGLYVRERHDGLYRPITYLAFKMLDELTLNFLVGLGSSAIIFYGVQLRGSFVYFWLNCMTTLSNGVLIAYMVAAFCPTLDVANAAVPTILAIMLFLSGFLIRIESIPVYWRWLTYADLLKYSWQGLMINQFEKNPEAELAGNPILEYYNLAATNKWIELAIIIGFFGAWSVLAWYALAFVRHQKR